MAVGQLAGCSSGHGNEIGVHRHLSYKIDVDRTCRDEKISSNSALFRGNLLLPDRHRKTPTIGVCGTAKYVAPTDGVQYFLNLM